VALTTHPLSSIDVKERVEVYLYSPCGPSWHVPLLTAPFTSQLKCCPETGVINVVIGFIIIIIIIIIIITQISGNTPNKSKLLS
jgi:hypothetical protein